MLNLRHVLTEVKTKYVNDRKVSTDILKTMLNFPMLVPETDIYLLSVVIVHELNHQNGDHSLWFIHVIMTPLKALFLYKL
jgi:hypothetical protein